MFNVMIGKNKSAEKKLIILNTTPADMTNGMSSNGFVVDIEFNRNIQPSGTGSIYIRNLSTLNGYAVIPISGCDFSIPKHLIFQSGITEPNAGIIISIDPHCIKSDNITNDRPIYLRVFTEITTPLNSPVISFGSRGRTSMTLNLIKAGMSTLLVCSLSPITESPVDGVFNTNGNTNYGIAPNFNNNPAVKTILCNSASSITITGLPYADTMYYFAAWSCNFNSNDILYNSTPTLLNYKTSR